MRLVLASQSPARRRWLKKLVRVRFPEIRMTIRPAYLDEKKLLRENFRGPLTLREARAMTVMLAKAKARAVHASFKSVDAVLGSDQLLFKNGVILGKPGTRTKARRMLAGCSGKTAYLVTSVALLAKNPKKSTKVVVRVSTQVAVLRFAKLTRAQIDRTLRLDEPFECAGSFMIEKHGATLLASIRVDDPTGIEGLPIMRVSKLLDELTSSYDFS